MRLGEFLPATLPALEPIEQTGQQVLTSTGQALGYVALAAEIIFIAIAILLLAYHWTLNGPRTIQSLMLLVPKGQRLSIYELITAMEAKVGYYIAGQGVLCLVIGIMALVAYLLIGLPNALVLALVAGVIGGRTNYRATARRHSCGGNCLSHRTFQVDLGGGRHSCYSAG